MKTTRVSNPRQYDLNSNAKYFFGVLVFSFILAPTKAISACPFHLEKRVSNLMDASGAHSTPSAWIVCIPIWFWMFFYFSQVGLLRFGLPPFNVLRDSMPANKKSDCLDSVTVFSICNNFLFHCIFVHFDLLFRPKSTFQVPCQVSKICQGAECLQRCATSSSLLLR